jgi:hypothetical protein
MPPLCTHPTTYEAVRKSMTRPLTPSEQNLYRGITSSATTGLKYDILYNIHTAEELIKAELYGRRAIPSDEPSTMYLFSSSRGKTAKFNDAYFEVVKKREKEEEERDESGEMKRIRERYVPKTMEELHGQYLDMKVPEEEEDKEYLEMQFEEIAKDVVTWWNELVASGSSDIGACRGRCRDGEEEEKEI